MSVSEVLFVREIFVKWMICVFGVFDICSVEKGHWSLRRSTQKPIIRVLNWSLAALCKNSRGFRFQVQIVHFSVDSPSIAAKKKKTTLWQHGVQSVFLTLACICECICEREISKALIKLVLAFPRLVVRRCVGISSVLWSLCRVV